MAGLLKAGQYLRIFRESNGLIRSEFANINYPPIPISEESEARIIGLVMWKGSKGSF